jgi:formylglycine-generating enzyme
MKEMYRFIIVILSIQIITACTDTGKKTNSDTERSEILSEQVPQQQQQPKIEKSADTIVTGTSGMVYFEGGKITIGSNTRQNNESPAFEVDVDPFYIDKHPVTVAQFRKFIRETGYQTEADRFGDAGVYDFEIGNWQLVKGANWEYPFGPEGKKAKDDHPVTQVSWNDAVAYAKWADKRLPTEIEWEYAAKNGQDTNNKFPWGNELIVEGKYKANVWQGDLQSPDTKDGYLYTNPVGAFGEYESGLTDLIGSVWEWCQDSYTLYNGNYSPFTYNYKNKVIRGGSFFYDQNGEASYTITGRSMNSTETSLFNTGFRCAKDAEK